jgi:hypothetical protein
MTIPKVLNIKVTAKDIKNGTISSPTDCPIAIASNRAISDLGGKPYNDVDISEGGFELKVAVGDLPLCNQSVIASYTPQKSAMSKIESFIHRFDNSKKVVPFEFVAKLIDVTVDY